jgi:PAS domain S-box-containing protein
LSKTEPLIDNGGGASRIRFELRVVMLQKQSDQIRMCHERAAEAKRKAEATADATLKADYLGMEERWLSVARHYEFTDRLADLTAAMSDKKNKSDGQARTHAGPDDTLLLQEISTSLIQEGDIHALYERILDGAVGLMNSDFGSMQIFHPEQNELRLLAWRGFHPASAAFWDRIHLGSVHTSCGVALRSGHRIVVPDAEECDLMAGSADLDHYRLSGIRAVQSTPLVSRSGELLGMISTHWREPHHPSEDSLRLIDMLARQGADLIERNRNEAARLDGEAKLRLLASIVESSDDAIVTKDLDGIITSWNRGAERIFGYSAKEAIGKPVTILIPPDRHDEEPTILERVRRGDRIDHYETVRLHKDGSRLNISLTVSPLRDAAGNIVGASKIARDITDRKRAEAQIVVLAREAEHRAKNVLATVQATVHLSHSDTPEGLKRSIEGRIQALANVHRLFVETRWTGADLRTLALDELSPYCQEGDARAQVDGTNVTVKPEVAQALAVILHELATNAAKYGALSVPGGRVHLGWSQASGQRLILRWTETGGPAAKPPTHQGFGTRVMKSVIGSLKGDIRPEWREDGLVCEIAIPV